MITTNWSDNNNDDENDYNSILDFVFLANVDWAAISKIIAKDEDFPDDEYTSDHRPVLGIMSTEAGVDLAGLAEEMDRSAIEPARSLEYAAATPRASMVNLNASTTARTQNLSLIQRVRTQQGVTVLPMAVPGASDLEALMDEAQRLRQEVEELKQQPSN